MPSGQHGLTVNETEHEHLEEPVHVDQEAKQFVSPVTSTSFVPKPSLEHCSHIRIDAKRQALDALDNLRRGSDAGNGNGKPANDAEIATIIDIADDLTSQSRHSLRPVEP